MRVGIKKLNLKDFHDLNLPPRFAGIIRKNGIMGKHLRSVHDQGKNRKKGVIRKL